MAVRQNKEKKCKKPFVDHKWLLSTDTRFEFCERCKAARKAGGY